LIYEYKNIENCEHKIHNSSNNIKVIFHKTKMRVENKQIDFDDFSEILKLYSLNFASSSLNNIIRLLTFEK